MILKIIEVLALLICAAHVGKYFGKVVVKLMTKQEK